MVEKEKKLITEILSSPFTDFPLYFRDVAEVMDLGPYPLNSEEVRAGVGIYIRHILDEKIKDETDMQYPTRLYAKIIEDLKYSGEISEEHYEKFKDILYNDVVYPDWKSTRRWYSKDSYDEIMEKIISILFSKTENYPFYMSLNYSGVTECAHIAFKKCINKERLFFPLKFN